MNDPIAQHIMLRLHDDRVIAPNRAGRRLLARAVLLRGREYGLLAFRASDNHVHLEAACERAGAGQFAKRVQLALRRTLHLPVAFEPARIKPVRGQRHLSNLLHYCFRQELHHGTALDPTSTASNLPDLLGMRVLGGYTQQNVHALLPRVSRAELLDHLGYPGLDRAPMDPTQVCEAAAEAFALPDLRGKSREVVEARRDVVHALHGLLPTRVLAAELGRGLRALRKLRATPALPGAVEAVSMQLRLRGALRARRAAGGPGPRDAAAPIPPRRVGPLAS